MKTVNNWNNHGDINLEHGAIFIKQDPDFSTCYNVLKNEYDHDGEQWILFDLYVDITDSWIEWDEVQSCCDTDLSNDIQKVTDVVSYYNHLNFGTMSTFKTLESLECELIVSEVIV